MSCGCSTAKSYGVNESNASLTPEQVRKLLDNALIAEMQPQQVSRPKPKRGCGNCRRQPPDEELPANRFCLLTDDDCGMVYRAWVYQWYYERYVCDDGIFYICKGPYRKDDCCFSDNEKIPVCNPGTDPYTGQRMRPCAKRIRRDVGP